MTRKSSKTTALVKNGVLYTEDQNTGVVVGSAAWWAWLDIGQTFYFDDDRFGTFTVRPEMRRQGFSWYGFKRRDGRLSKRYVGRRVAVTMARLREVAGLL